MTPDSVLSPTGWLSETLGPLPLETELTAWERHWRTEGEAVSDAVDRAGTPHVRMFDALGQRVDEVVFPPGYRALVAEGYRRGLIWRAFESGTPLPFFLLGYVTSFFDAGIYCPYTVSMSTAIPLDKYGTDQLKARFLGEMLRRDGGAWQGATWMTEAAGGSDLGAGVVTRAREIADGTWWLSGDKYFCSNVGAELAVVAARPEGAPDGVRGLALFLVPKVRANGASNYTLRRLKDKVATRSVPTGEVEFRDTEAWLLGPRDVGVYLILEVLNVSRVANSVGSVALMQRAIADAVAFGRRRVAFGRPVAAHPLLARQIDERLTSLREAFALAWEAVSRLGRVWRETPRYSDDYHAFRLTAHLAKYWTAEQAAQTAKWAMEVLGGVGTQAENRVERWLREAMILAIWEGTPHRQMIDGLEVMERHRVHEALLESVAGTVSRREIDEWRQRIAGHLARPRDEREAGIEPLFSGFARFMAGALARRTPVAQGLSPAS